MFTGINHGPNTGQTVLHLGTVGAALTAQTQGIPALAVSLASAEPTHRDAAAAAAQAVDWHELDAVRAHAALDHADGTDHGWAAKADALHARLVPQGLDPDPLATVERIIAAQKATGRGNRRPGER